MANLSLPQRGQPIDFQFIYEMVDAINNLSDQQNATSSHINIYTDTGNQKVDLNHLAIDAGYARVTLTSESVDKPVPGKYTFQITNFASPPIVTITPVTNNQKLAVDDDAIVVITNVTTSEVNFKITFPKASAKNKGSVSVYVQAIGISK